MDRRTVWAILLMMVIAIIPAIFLKRPRPAPGVGDTSAVAPRAQVPAAAPAPAPPAAGQSDTLHGPDSAAAAAAAIATVPVTSPLYDYRVSTQGGRLVSAQLKRYRSMAPEDHGALAQILPPDSRLLGLTVVAGRDTIPL